jgi:hypothetical protein
MKRDIEQEPTAPMIQEVYDAVQDFWTEQFMQDKDLIELIEGEHKIEVADTEAKGRKRKIEPERMESREAARSVNQVRAFYTAPAAIQVEWIGETAPKAEKKAEQIGRAINEIVNQLNPPIDSPIKRERWWMVALGRSARLIVPGNAYWWDFPEKEKGKTTDEWWATFSEWRRNAPLPLLWKDLLPQQTFSPTFGRMNDEVVSWLDLSWHELDEVFSDAEMAKLGDRDAAERFYGDEKRAFRLLIFSNVKWLAYAVMAREGKAVELLRTYEHGMDRPAIRILPGMTSGTKQPGKYWQSVLEDVRKMIPQVDRRLSEAATASKFDSLPMFKQWLNQGSDASGVEKFFEGDLIPLQQGMGADQPREDIEPLFSPEFGEKTLTLAQFGLARIERITGAVEALEGAFGPSGQPAWARNFAHEVAKSKFSELTDGVIASDLDAADSIMRALSAFGETVRIPTHPGHGKGSPRITLNPEDMENYRATLKGEYSLRVPINKRADLDLAVSMMERVNQSKLPIPMPYIFSSLMDVEDPYKMYEESLVWDFLMSEPVRQLHQDELVKELKGDIAGDEGMAVDDFMKESEGWPDEVRQAVLQEVLGPAAMQPPPTGGGANSFYGGGGGISGETQGAMRAGKPFMVEPGGPKPNA